MTLPPSYRTASSDRFSFALCVVSILRCCIPISVFDGFRSLWKLLVSIGCTLSLPLARWDRSTYGARRIVRRPLPQSLLILLKQSSSKELARCSVITLSRWPWYVPLSSGNGNVPKPSHHRFGCTNGCSALCVVGPGLAQDNDSVHTSDDVRIYLRNAGVKRWEDWPPYSPDLNLIENVWGFMTSRMAGHPCSNVRDLRALVEHTWDSITGRDIERLYGSLRARYVCNQERW